MAGFVAAFLEFCQQFFLLGSEIGGSFDDGSVFLSERERGSKKGETYLGEFGVRARSREAHKLEGPASTRDKATEA